MITVAVHLHSYTHCPTKAQFLPGELPFGVIWQLGGVNIYMVVSMDSLDDLPLNLELWFLLKFRGERKSDVRSASRDCLLCSTV